MARSDVEPWIALDVDFRKMRELNGNGGAISSYFEKTQFTGEVVAVLAPSHGHAPLHRPQLPGALVRGSRAELPSLPRPQRSLWPHCDEIVRMTEVPLQMPGIERREHIVSPPRTRSPPRVHVLVQEDEDEDEEMHFDAEAALAAARRERSQRTDSAVRGRPLGRGGPGEPGGSGEPDGPGGPGAKALRCEGPEARSESEAEMKCSHAQRSRDSSREREAAQAAFSNLAHAEAMMLASLRPRTRVTPKIQLVARPPVVEIPRVERQPEGKPERTVDGRVERADRRESISRRGSLSPPRRKASERDLRAREKIGKLLVAHYEVSTRSEAKKQQMLMRVILANEEKNSEALTEGLALLQNAQNLIGGEKSTKSRVTLKALCLLDRKINVRSTIADSVRTLEELTRRKEKLLVDMVPAGKEEDVSASVGLHLEDADLRLADALKKSWEEVHREASSWAPEKAKESAAVKVFERLKHKKEAEREAALEQMRQALGIAVWRFAQAEAQKEDDLLGGESLQRAARIEYAIKAAEAQGVDPRHQSLSKALQIAFDLRALRAMRYCQHLMSSIEPDVLGSAGKVANLIDQVIQDASELYGVPKDHKHMEEARRLVLKARTEEAQAKRRAAQS